MKYTVSERALASVEQAVRERKGELTPHDAAANTGLTVMEAQEALERLLEIYVTRVSFDDQGRVLFDFEWPLRQWGKKTLKERWAAVRDAFWSGFKVFMKIWIAVVMIGYFLVMLLLLIGLLVAGRSSDRDDRGGHAEGMIGALFHGLAEALRFAFYAHAFGGGYATDPYGYRYREAAVPHNRRKKKNEKSFFIAVYDFALGPERVEADPLADEREVAAYLRVESGILTPSEIVALSGGTLSDAEERMAEYLARFQGRPTVTEEGIVLGEFEDFLAGSSGVSHDESAIVPFWQEYEAPFKVTGNSSGRNVIIAIMGAVTLIGGVVFGPGGSLETLAYAYQVPFLASTVAEVILGWMPLVFGLVFLGLPLLRYPAVKANEARRLRRNRKKEVIRAIFTNQWFRTTPEEIHRYVSSGQHGEKLDRDQIEETLGQLVLDLQGEIELQEDGTTLYTFERLQREHFAARKARHLLE